jgi:hypothetical protein
MAVRPVPDAPPSFLSPIREREQAATPGPWSTQRAVIAGLGGAYVIEHGEDEIALVDCAGDLRLEQELADAEFIAESRTAIPRLLAAVEAALKLHGPGCVTILGALCKRHENHRFFSITATEADDVRACRDCEATVYTSCAGCGTGASVEACPTRAAITTALAGEEADGGG